MGGEGAAGGLFAGYNHIFSGRFLGGVEVEGNLQNVRGQLEGEIYGPYYRHDWSAAARLRLGFFPNPNALLYLSAGAEVGNFDYGDGYMGPARLSYQNLSHTLAGLQLGLGAETFLSRNISVRAEAIYTHYAVGRIIDTHGDPDSDFRPDVLTTRFGIAYHPGWLGGEQAPAVRDIPDASWDGFYAGGQVGMTMLNPVESYDPSYSSGYDPYYDYSAHGASVGGHAGFNRQFGMWVAGLEADAALQSDTVIYEDHVYGNQTWSASARARLGVLAKPNVLVYATAGLAMGGFNYGHLYGFNPALPYSGATFTGTGLQVGAGVEAFFTHNVSMRVEGLYTSYAAHDITYADAPYWIIEPHTLEARAGLSYHFN
jgi:outer membrane immunogenic protein